MGDLYWTTWADHSCVDAAWQAPLYTAAICAAVTGLIGGAAWLFKDRIPPEKRRPALLGLVAPFGIAGMLFILLIAYFALVDTVIRRVSVSRTTLTARWCDGLAA